MKADINLTNKQKFTLEIARLSQIHGLNTLDSILYFCEINDCDVLDIVPVVDRSIKDMLFENYKDRREIKQEFIVSKLF
jgi:hypothetical protein